MSGYEEKFLDSGKSWVSYEDFGAVGDGVTDDFDAIQRAHEFANNYNYCVRTHPAKTYYIGETFSEVRVMTDVDWGMTRFTIDDSKVPPDNRHRAIFKVCSEKEKIELTVHSIKKGQARIDISLPSNSLVTVNNRNKRQFMRYGPNQNSGTSQSDCFIIDKSGYILTPTVWDFDEITSITAYPIDERVLKISGGIFTTVANQAASGDAGYYGRNIVISRSNVIIDGTAHYVTGELDTGAPYGGFISVYNSAYVTIQNFHFSAHFTYMATGAEGKPVTIGTYDINLTKCINISFINCKQNDIVNSKLWGTFGMNGCKNILFDGCVLSRVDAHMDVTNYYIKNCILGWQGVNAIGHGDMIIENTTVFCYTFVELRQDYGCTWDGNLVIKDCTWYPINHHIESPTVITSWVKGDHDFGYPLYMPRKITIENLKIMDGDNQSERYFGPCAANAFVNGEVKGFGDDKAESDSPFIAPLEMHLKNITVQSGKGFRIWNGVTATCWCEKKHKIEEDGEIDVNFKAYVEGINGFTVQNSDTLKGEYGNNHRLVPYIEIKNCDNVYVDKGAYPMIVEILK